MDGGATSTEADPTYTFNTAGSYDVSLTVTDEGGLTDTDIITIVVSDAGNLPPTAVITANPQSGEVPLEVTFTGDGSTDDGTIVSYSWDFGDGATSTDANPTHTFTEPGIYTVTLTVEDDGGLTDSANITITVTEVAGEMAIILLLNPTQDGIARLQITNLPNGVVADNFMIHDYIGRFVMMSDAQTSFQDGEYQLDVAILGVGLYFVTVELSDGEILATKMLVQN